MCAYNICSPLSGGALQLLAERVKAFGNEDQLRVRVGSVDCLAASYRTVLDGLKDAGPSAIVDLPTYQQFLPHLNSIGSVYRNFLDDAGDAAETTDARAAWPALVSQLFAGERASLLEDWMYLSLYCILRLMRTYPDLVYVTTGVTPDSTEAAVDNYEDEEGEEGDNLKQQLYAELCGSTEAAEDFVYGFSHGCRVLPELQLAGFVRDAVIQAIDRTIHDAVHAQAAQWYIACLRPIHAGVLQTMRLLDSFLETSSLVRHAEAQVYSQFSALRVSELFSIIIDYPDSQAAIADLRECTLVLHNMREVAFSLRAAIEQRLLHPGATTGDILTQYISAIRCLRLLDPSSTVLEIVARPIRQYLRVSRDQDTVACIVQDMVSEESELFEDLGHQHTLRDSLEEGVVFDEDCNTRDWVPLPVEAKAVYRTAQRRDADVLGLLVSIYDTQDVFVHEFERHLAQSLLAQADFDTAREIRQVEMMKLRFGAAAMERCEVMLKDLADSRRISQSSEGGHTHQSIVVSRQFWSLSALEQQQQYTMPPQIAGARERYAELFEAMKPARKLEWRDAQSEVSLHIELGDRKVDVTVRPDQAAVLFAFQETGRTSLDDLVHTLECSEDFALSRVRFWVARGMLREVDAQVFEPVESGSEPSGSGSAAASDNEEAEEDSGAGAEDARTEALRMNFNYIVGMLTNFGPLPLDRILSMLSMFVPGDTTTPEELRAFLALMVREDKLDMTGGMYKLK
ncbi:Anaphase-promoting complex subunit 2 [Coemansia sp. RSA 552]|nr:Anaphase-promoting complex subunit 2 [Coemansia sp. RSA 552]